MWLLTLALARVSLMHFNLTSPISNFRVMCGNAVLVPQIVQKRLDRSLLGEVKVALWGMGVGN